MAAANTELVEQFKAESSRACAAVYEATSVDDASDYVLKLAQERDVKHAVKSKSKLADKLRLRERLEKTGIEVKETDLEEWIAQLGRKKPTGQKTLEQITELISKAIGKKLNPDPRILLSAANREMRQSCINADMGISEASVAIAETGTLVIMSNSGDSRLVAVLPRIHLTVVDCGSIVPTLEDAAARIKSFGRSMTDGNFSSYVTYITGRNTTADIPGAILARAQGPAEEHILLLNKAASNRGIA